MNFGFNNMLGDKKLLGKIRRRSQMDGEHDEVNIPSSLYSVSRRGDESPFCKGQDGKLTRNDYISVRS